MCIRDRNSRQRAWHTLFDQSVCPEDLMLLAKADHLGRANAAPYEETEREIGERFAAFQETMARPYVTDVYKRQPMTTETLISGQGELELEIVRQKLQSKFGAEAVFKDPKIAYRESIRKTIQVQGRHKKQSGGHGQFGDVWIEFSPAEPRCV